MGTTSAWSGFVVGISMCTLAVAVFESTRKWLGWVGDLEARRLAEEGKSKKSRSSPSTRRLSVVIPAFNEEKRLPKVLDETLQYLAKRRDREGPSFTYEVIVVDDGSSDSTVSLAWLCARDMGAEEAVRIIDQPRNRGKGAAVRVGALASRGDLVLMMDADGATDLPHGLGALELAICNRLCQRQGKLKAGARGGNMPGGKEDLVQLAGGYKRIACEPCAALGSRAHLQDEDAVTKRTKIRNFAMHGFHMLVYLVVGGNVRDTQCGFKLFTRAAAMDLFRHQRLERWCFDVELISIAQRLRVPLCEVQVNWEEKEGSKLKFFHVFHMAIELLTVFVCYNSGLWRVLSQGQPDPSTHKAL